MPAGVYSVTALGYWSFYTATSSTFTIIVIRSADRSITSPANGATFNTDANIPIDATAQACTGASISKVDFYQGGTKLGTCSTSPYSFTWNNVATGSYSLTATATDSNSLSTTSSPPVTITVDTPPTCLLVFPVSPTVYQAPATVLLSATAHRQRRGDDQPGAFLSGRIRCSARFDLALQFHLDECRRRQLHGDGEGDG